jgi:hypothetical protein
MIGRDRFRGSYSIPPECRSMWQSFDNASSPRGKVFGRPEAVRTLRRQVITVRNADDENWIKENHSWPWASEERNKLVQSGDRQAKSKEE